MAQCVICNSYYKKSKWNSSDNCEDCLYSDGKDDFIEEDDEIDLNNLVNPSGRTMPKFIE